MHCHTPMGSVVARLAAREARKDGTRVIYTAHGYHFYKGAPLINWLLYYPIEKWLAKYTDTQITITQEDYELAKEKFKIKDLHLVHGVGLDEEKFNILIPNEEKEKRNIDDRLRACLGEDAVIKYSCKKELLPSKNGKFKTIINKCEK